MEYLTRWRMLLAADRLKNSSDGLSAISQSLGYESESAFGKAFPRVMGCSPRLHTRSTAPYIMPAMHTAEEWWAGSFFRWKVASIHSDG
jgi:AraC-like DNA-binding protein